MNRRDLDKAIEEALRAQESPAAPEGLRDGVDRRLQFTTLRMAEERRFRFQAGVLAAGTCAMLLAALGLGRLLATGAYLSMPPGAMGQMDALLGTLSWLGDATWPVLIIALGGICSVGALLLLRTSAFSHR